MAIPAAAGSMAPNLARGPHGGLVLSWVEPDGAGHVLRFSVLGIAGWAAPRTIARGNSWFVNWADFPSVVPLSGDLWAAHWLQSQPDGGYAYDVKITMSNDNGETWSEAFLPHFDGTPTEHGFVTLFPDGNGLGLVWLDGRKMINDFDANDVGASGMTLRAATFGIDQAPTTSALVDDLTCDCCQTDLALTDDGPVVVYRNRTEEEVRDIYVSRREAGKWQDGVAVASDNWEMPACPVNGPIIRANGSNVAVAWFTAADDRPRVQAAWSRDAARTFSEPLQVSTERPLGHVGAVLLANGDLVVSWQQGTGGGKAALMLRRVSSAGEMSAPYRLQEAVDIFSFSVPQLALAGNEVVVVWTTSVNNVYGVHGAVLPLDVLD